MIRRFQIEDLIFQDGSGVVFRALDTETGRMVAVRRFLPFGTNGGGLLEDERTAYDIALVRLAGLNHPALRSVICGGCDPVDGIPFVATEWIDGSTLEPIIRQRPLPADVAVLLLTQALEVSEMLSHVLAEETLWVETNPATIMLGNEESGRGFTFWISPLKWLGRHEQPRGLQSIITLTEEIMGWKGRVVNDEAGQGLGAWLKWLRKAAPTTTLREARENLAAAIGSEPPPPAKTLVTAAARRPAPKSSKSSKHVVLAGLGLVLILAGLGGWLVTRNRSMARQPDLATTTAEPPSIPEVKPRTVEPNEKPLKADQKKETAQATKPAAVAKQTSVFSPAESALLIKEKDRTVTLEGRLAKADPVRPNKKTYLYFSGKAPANEVRGVLSAKAAAGFNATPLIGKKLRITGKVKVVKGRPEIEIANHAAIKAME